jgi:mono/diheme cytochrome c family protein
MRLFLFLPCLKLPYLPLTCYNCERLHILETRHNPMHRTILLATCIGLLLAGCSGSSGPTPTPTIDPASDAGVGRTLFQANCAACHSTAEAVMLVGPSLAHIATTSPTRVEGLSAEDYLRESIVAPDAYTVDGFLEGTMQQNFGQVLTSEEVDHIVAYLMTLE